MKIKYLIDTLLSNDIKLLPFIDRYSGIVRTLDRKQNSFNGEGGEVKRYPVSCDVQGADCDDLSIIENLIPNDDKNSVVYWEEITPMLNVGETKLKSFYQKKFRGTARIVVWLNLAKLGATCVNYIEAYAELEKTITKKLKVSSGIYAGSLVLIQPKGDVIQDKKTVFGKYTYNDFINYYLYPYDFFAIDVVFEMEHCLTKGATVPINPSIDCPNEFGVTACDKIKAQLNDELLLECILPLYDFSELETQAAVSVQQRTDLTNWLCTPVVPPVPYSMLLDGINEDFIMNSSVLNDLNGFQPFTVSTWVYLQKYTVSLVCKTAGTGTGMTIAVFSTFVQISIRGISLDVATKRANVIIPLNAWVQITCTYNGSGNATGFNVYVNSVLITNVSIPFNNFTTNTQNTGSLTIGSNAGATPMQGYISYTRMWGVEFNQANVTQDYNAGQLLESAILPTDLRFEFKAGQSGVYATNIWSLPNIANEQNGFASRNLEFVKRTTFIP